MSNIQAINHETLLASSNFNIESKNLHAKQIAGLQLITIAISAVDSPESANTIAANIQAAGYEALIDQMINSININKDNPAVIESCKKTIDWAISRLKFIASSADSKYQAQALKILSYYKSGGAQNLINNWSTCWTMDIANGINTDLMNWEKNNPTILENCNRDTLFGILMFSSDANKLHLPNAVQMFSSPSDSANDYALFMLHYLWTTFAPAALSSSNDSQISPQLDMWDVENIVAAVSYSEDGTNEEKPFENFTDKLIDTFNKIRLMYPIWPEDTYPSYTIEHKALLDWKEYLNS